MSFSLFTWKTMQSNSKQTLKTNWYFVLKIILIYFVVGSNKQLNEIINKNEDEKYLEVFQLLMKGLISSIFDKCSMMLQTIWPWNHTSHTKVYFNEFVANTLHDNKGMVNFDQFNSTFGSSQVPVCLPKTNKK